MADKVRFVDSSITISPGGDVGGGSSISSSYALSASYASTAAFLDGPVISASYALSASYAVSASYEIIKEESSSFAETASYVNPLTQDVIVTGSLETTQPIETSGYVFIDHNGAAVSGGTAALFLGTTNTGMDLVRLDDSSLVLGGVTQNYGWRIFGIKHGLKGSTYTTEIDNLIATGSMKISGSIDIAIPSGSAFTITETDKSPPHDSRLDF